MPPSLSTFFTEGLATGDQTSQFVPASHRQTLAPTSHDQAVASPPYQPTPAPASNHKAIAPASDQPTATSCSQTVVASTAVAGGSGTAVLVGATAGAAAFAIFSGPTGQNTVDFVADTVRKWVVSRSLQPFLVFSSS